MIHGEKRVASHNKKQTPKRPFQRIGQIANSRLFKTAYIMALVFLFVGAGTATALRYTINSPPPIAANDTRISTDDVLLKQYIRTYGPDKTIMYIKTLPVDCHQRVHKVGRLNYELNGNKAFTLLNSECMSGYTHGVTEAYFHKHGTEKLNESLELICQGQQNGFYSHQCFHGVGHGLMAYTDYDLPAALKSCDTIPAAATAKESCYSGVFMENVVGAITIEKAKSSPNPSQYHVTNWLSDDPLFPCNKVDAVYKNGCYIFQTSRMVQVLNYDFQKIAALCASIEQEYRYVCYSSMGRDVSASFGKQYSQIENSCAYGPEEQLRLACVDGAAQDKFWHESQQDSALEMCRGLQRAEFKNNCYITLNRRANEIIASTESKKAFCAKYEPTYANLCQAKQ